MKIRSYVLLLLTASHFSALHAQFSADMIDEQHVYDVEIVIFKNDVGPKGKEYILPISSPRKDDTILDLSSRASIEAAKKQAYQVLGADKLRLTDAVLRIVESPRYSLLVHTAWRQPGLEKDRSMPVWIKGGEVFGPEYTSIDNKLGAISLNADDKPLVTLNAMTVNEINSAQGTLMATNPASNPVLYELEGKITIALSRYLHAYVELVLRRPRQLIDQLVDKPDIEQFQYETADSKILNNHSLIEHRRLRSSTLHYLDNPEFSMLILITPYEPKQAVTN